VLHLSQLVSGLNEPATVAVDLLMFLWLFLLGTSEVSTVALALEVSLSAVKEHPNMTDLSSC
jgi:hypothetical protein